MRYNLDGVFGEIDSLPGCSQVGVSHAVFIPEEFRGKGLGHSAHVKRVALMKNEFGYDYALCTVDQSNIKQLGILSNNRWTYLDEFLSRKTGHWVGLYGKKLNEV